MTGRVPLGMVALAGLAAACEPEPEPPPPPLHPCHSERAELDVAPPNGEFGDLQDGDDLWCGNPPQGGAPYSPFRVRLLGPEAIGDGIHLEMVAVEEGTGAELAYTDLTMGLTCANVGDNDGYWVGSEAHMRYSGWGLDELDGRAARLTLTATTLEGDELAIERTWEVGLVLD